MTFPVLLRPDDLIPVEEDDDNDLLWSAAARVGRVELEEAAVGIAKKFDEKLHPRWPKGTPRAGEFMKKGQWFEADGKKWQIVSTAGGHIEAIEASGKVGATEHRIFEPESKAIDGPGVAVPNVTPAKPSTFDRNTSPVVDPYVDPATHDPSIKMPEGAKLSADEWKRFGREDQLYYADLMKRFGAWKPSTSKSLMAQLYSQYDSGIQSIVAKAFSGNKGGTGFWQAGAGQWLNLAWLLKNVSANPKTAWQKYQDAKVAFDDMSEVTHWDLYNRTKAPDITLFHGGGGTAKGAHYELDFLTGKKPIYAGFSQSYSLSGAESWGSKIIATPTSIKHVSMSYYTPLPGGTGCWGELEIALGVRMKLDDRSVVFNSHDFNTSGAAVGAIRTWLKGMTGSQPAGGHIIEELKDVWAGKGNIPIPPTPANIQVVGEGQKQYVELPPDVGAKALQMVKGLGYKSEDGSKEAALGKIDSMGLKPGDFIEGKAGTRYVIIKDPADTADGLRYVKVMDSSGTVEPVPNYAKSYKFQDSALDFYRLDGHVDVPKPPPVKGFSPFTEEQYAKLAKGKQKPLEQFAPGEMFSHEGEGYKVVGPTGGGLMHIESLDSGKKHTANAGFKAVQLVPSEGFEPPADVWIGGIEQPAEGALLIHDQAGGGQSLVHYGGKVAGDLHTIVHPNGTTSTVQLTELQEVGKPLEGEVEAGDIFAHDGKKFTVTSVLKDGTVRARPQGGKVQKFGKVEVMKMLDAGAVVRPNDFVLGEKVKAKELAIGQLVSGSSAKKRPYIVVRPALPGAKVVVLRNLETGELVNTSKNKSWPLLSQADLTPPEPKSAKPPNPETVAFGDLKPSGTKVPLASVGEGTKFKHGAMLFEVTQAGTHGKVINEDGTYGKELPYPADSGSKEVEIMVAANSDPDVHPPDHDAPAAPPNPGKFDQSQYTEGGKVKLGDAELGTVFLSKTGLPMLLKSNKPKGGATAVALHNGKTVKNISYTAEFTELVAKAESSDPLPYEDATPGDQIVLSKLGVGDQYALMDGMAPVEIVEIPEDSKAHPIVSPIDPATGAPTAQKATAVVSPDDVVILKAKAADKPKATPAAPAWHDDALQLDLYPDYESYLHAKSGKNQYPQLKSMPEGTFFKDKNGKSFKVVATANSDKGEDWTVISDGENPFRAQGDWRGKVSDVPLFQDPPSGEPNAGVAAPDLADEEGPPILEDPQELSSMEPQLPVPGAPGETLALGLWAQAIETIPDEGKAVWTDELTPGQREDVLAYAKQEGLSTLAAHLEADPEPEQGPVTPGLASTSAVMKDMSVGTRFVGNDGEVYKVIGKSPQFVNYTSVNGSFTAEGPQIDMSFPVLLDWSDGGPDPADWVAGDVIEAQSGALARVVETPGEYAQLEHLGGDLHGEKFSLHTAALVQTYQYRWVGHTGPPRSPDPAQNATPAAALTVGDVFHFKPDGSAHSPSGYKVMSKAGDHLVTKSLDTENVWEGEASDLGEVFGVVPGDPVEVPAGELPVGTIVTHGSGKWKWKIAGPVKDGKVPLEITEIFGQTHSAKVGDPDTISPKSHMTVLWMPDAGAGIAAEEKTLADVEYGDVVWKPDPDTLEPPYVPHEVLAVTKDKKGEKTISVKLSSGTYDAQDDFLLFTEPDAGLLAQSFSAGDTVNSEQMDDLPPGTVVENGVVEYEKMGEGAGAPWRNTLTGNTEYGPTGEWTIVSLGSGATTDPITPYLHPKSGKFKYPRLATVPPGTKFQDKAKKSYVVLSIDGSQALIEDEDGKQFTASSEARVKILGIEEALLDARLVFTTAGRVRMSRKGLAGVGLSRFGVERQA